MPAGATRVDLKGKTILPGLVNAHGHVPRRPACGPIAASYTRDNLLRQLRTYAMYGVTTVFSLGDDQAAGFELRNENATAADRARLFVAGPVISGDTAEEARANDRARSRTMKPDLLKIRVDDNLGSSRKMPEAAWRAVIEEARRAQAAGRGAHLLAGRRQGDAAGRRRHDRAQRARRAGRRSVHQRAEVAATCATRRP